VQINSVPNHSRELKRARPNGLYDVRNARYDPSFSAVRYSQNLHGGKSRE
jgi:hypothetical protein